MYGKIHGSFFDSSINDSDQVTRLVFIGMIVLSDKEGRIDVTTQALARRLNLDHDALVKSIAVLGSPDPHSRSAADDGRRIVPIDPTRSWGWIVVNKAEYRDGRGVDGDDVRDQNRQRKRRQRERDTLLLHTSSSPNANTTDTDTGGVTVTHRHAESRSSHVASRVERDSIFERLWSLVPRKEGKIEARKHFAAFLNGTCEADPERVYAGNPERLAADLERAIANYAQQVRIDGIERRYVKTGGPLFYNFRDYVERQPSSPAAAGPVLVPLGGQR